MSVLARVFEEAGLATVAIALIRNHAERAKPPRALFVPFPLGFALGRPNDPAFQHRVLRAAFDLLAAEAGPVLADFDEGIDAPPEVLSASEASAAPQGSAPHAGPPAGAGSAPHAGPPAGAGSAPQGSVAPREVRPHSAADEITALRGYYEQWVAEHDGGTMVGLCGIPQRRWRGLIRYLEGFAAGDPPWYAEVPRDMPLARFLRYAADDLKAFCLEARMARRPEQVENELHRWFWSETAVGALLRAVADRMAESGDPEMGLYARGIAR